VRWAEGFTARLRALEVDLDARDMDVLVVSSSLAANAALSATATIQIVQASGASPVRTGAAGSLARPQRNLTGFTNQSEDVSGKLLELLSLAVPGISRVGVLMDPGAPVTKPQLQQAQDAARILSLRILPVGISEPAGLESAFAEFARERVTGLVVFSAAVLVSLSRRIVELARTARLPAIYPFLNFVRHGGLMAYGVDHDEQFRRAARLVDRILQGASPRDFPVEQPTRFYFLVNLKAAKELGLEMPPMLLARADEVIE
jgi:putative ABC transport system substrate-binding protein